MEHPLVRKIYVTENRKYSPVDKQKTNAEMAASPISILEPVARLRLHLDIK